MRNISSLLIPISLSRDRSFRSTPKIGHVLPKRLVTIDRNHWSRLSEMTGHDAPKYATLGAGLSSPGRLHDLMVTCEAMSPGEIKTQGAGLEISFGNAPTPFGDALIAWTQRGICHLGFVDADTFENALTCLRKDWSGATFTPDPQHALQLAATIFNAGSATQPLHLLLRGTNFQIKVWETLISVPSGKVVSYTQLAKKAGVPKACRSVGTAIGKNNIALLIPCHRVIRETGEIGGYRWGSDRKAALLAREGAQLELKRED